MVRTHQLVAQHFVDNPNNLPEVNHKDLDRTNAKADNLEWSTHQDNVKYSADRGKYKKPYGEKNANSKKIKLLSSDGLEIDFNYIAAAAQYLIDNGHTKSSIHNASTEISKCASHVKDSYLGFFFEFIK